MIRHGKKEFNVTHSGFFLILDYLPQFFVFLEYWFNTVSSIRMRITVFRMWCHIAWFKVTIIFDPDDRGSVLLCSVSNFVPDYMATVWRWCCTTYVNTKLVTGGLFSESCGIVCGWVPVPAKEHNRQFVIIKWHNLESNHWVKLNCTLKARTVLTFRHGAEIHPLWLRQYCRMKGDFGGGLL